VTCGSVLSFLPKSKTNFSAFSSSSSQEQNIPKGDKRDEAVDKSESTEKYERMSQE